jgi:diaminopimelate decarboxylase
MLNSAFHFAEGRMFADSVPVSEIAAATGAPVFTYSSRRLLGNFKQVLCAFHEFDAAVHYSAKANANLALLRILIHAGAGHEIVRVKDDVSAETILEYQVVGPVCENTDMLNRSTYLPAAKAGDLVVILTVGAYSMVMSNNYNAHPRPPEVVIDPDGKIWRVTRRRETYEEMITLEML